MRSLLLVSTLMLAACPALDSTPDPDPIVDPTPDQAALTGSYTVTSAFAVPATVAAPGPLGESLELLHQLDVNPAGAILDFAAGGVAMDALRDVLPPSLEENLEGWMNGYLTTAAVHGRIAAVDAKVRSVLLRWDLRSALVLPPGGGGTHAPIALLFDTDGTPIVIPVDNTAPVTAGTGVTATVTWPDGGGAPTVALGDHFMGVPFGSYALTALDFLLARDLGAADLRAALGQAVDCSALAASVANRCITVAMIDVCVGHRPELTAVCDAGLAAAAAKLEEKILGLNYEAIHYDAGVAAVDGAVRDAAAGTAIATGLSSGHWTSTIDLRQVPQEATATFTATAGLPAQPLAWSLGDAFAALTATGFDSPANALLAATGSPGHSMQDVIVAPGEAVVIHGKFAYGPISMDLQGEKIQVFLDDGSGWRSLGTATTDTDGRIAFTVAERLSAGVYDVRLEVLGDGTLAPGRIWNLPRGTHLAISDIDGTLTTRDEELIQDVFADLYEPILGGDFVPAAWPGGVGLTHALADRGWVVVYLTGRPYLLTDKTRGWLADGGFAWGPLHTTDTNGEALPIESGVGAFKRAWLRDLAARGFLLDEAYGNATTDVYAYAGAGIPAGRTWIIGPNGGAGGTHAVVDAWTARAAQILAAPAVVQPFVP